MFIALFVKVILGYLELEFQILFISRYNVLQRHAFAQIIEYVPKTFHEIMGLPWCGD